MTWESCKDDGLARRPSLARTVRKPAWQVAQNANQAAPRRRGALARGDLLAIAHGLSALRERFEPCQHSRPTPVALGHFGVGCEPAMANSDESSLICWFQLPTDGSFHVTRPAYAPRVDQ